MKNLTGLPVGSMGGLRNGKDRGYAVAADSGNGPVHFAGFLGPVIGSVTDRIHPGLRPSRTESPDRKDQPGVGPWPARTGAGFGRVGLEPHPSFIPTKVTSMNSSSPPQ